ncbi:MAG: CRISPR-associated endonuclease Cas3'', partial [Syntrophales bacterium]
MNELLAHKNQSLVSHLEGVSKRAESFAKAFDADEYGRLAGILHDLGKAETEFQKRINTQEPDGTKEPHAHHGAGYALRSCATPQWPVALAVNGHHAGLHNRGDVDQKADQYRERARACLEKIQDNHPEFSFPMPHELPEWLSGLDFFPGNKGDGWLATDLFTRFLFSALVDADRLDTEENDEDGEKK